MENKKTFSNKRPITGLLVIIMKNLELREVCLSMCVPLKCIVVIHVCLGELTFNQHIVILIEIKHYILFVSM